MHDTDRSCSLFCFYLVGRGLVSAVTHAVLTSGRWLRTTCSLLACHLQQQKTKGAVVAVWSQLNHRPPTSGASVCYVQHSSLQRKYWRAVVAAKTFWQRSGRFGARCGRRLWTTAVVVQENSTKCTTPFRCSSPHRIR